MITLALATGLTRPLATGLTGRALIPANAILYNGVPLMYNGNYLIYTPS